MIWCQTGFFCTVIITTVIVSTWLSNQLIIMKTYFTIIFTTYITITSIINKCTTNLFPWWSLRHKQAHSKNPCYPTASLWRRIYIVWMGIDLEFLFQIQSPLLGPWSNLKSVCQLTVVRLWTCSCQQSHKFTLMSIGFKNAFS